MDDPTTLPLIAQNDAPLAQSGDGHEQKGDHSKDKHGGPAGSGEPMSSSDIFNSILSQLGDHHEITFGNTVLFHLPFIVIDDGVHVYMNEEALLHGGKFEMDHKTHHVVRKGTHEAPMLDMSITSLIFFQWVAIVLMLAIFVPMARKYKKAGVRPLRGFHNAIEGVILYVRDQIVLPNTGADGKKLMPIFLTIFFFILVMNLVGLVPGGHSSTGNLNVTAGLAIIAFVTIQLAAIFKNGFGSWLKHLTGGVPMWLWPIMVPVEVLGLFTKPFALCVRLFANMTAGHVILLSLIGLSFVASTFIPVTLGFSLFINILELLVAFIQAYIFTMLTAVFTGIGMASHDHGDDHGGEHAAAH